VFHSTAIRGAMGEVCLHPADFSCVIHPPCMRKICQSCERAAVHSSCPSLGLSPYPPEVNPEGERGTGLVSSFNPNSCMGARARTSKEGTWRLTQNVGIVGIDISKRKADACIRASGASLSKPSTPADRAELIGRLRKHGVGLAVMEASGGYERDWAEALREAGFEVASSIRNGCAISPDRWDACPRALRSMPR
jgi:hypothetical protein